VVKSCKSVRLQIVGGYEFYPSIVHDPASIAWDPMTQHFVITARAATRPPPYLGVRALPHQPTPKMRPGATPPKAAHALRTLGPAPAAWHILAAPRRTTTRVVRQPPSCALWRPRFLISVINTNDQISWVKPADTGQT
jgi:hypothetical protein